jgi:NAD(P)-dependent dehydrogenase (short-subunit alcohol dehydrogenase family)
MTSTEFAGTPALVTGASRGFGRAIATSLTEAGADVIGVARDTGQLRDLRAEVGGSFTPVTADAADPVAAYAAREGLDVPTFLGRSGPALTAAQVGAAVTGLISDPGADQDAYLLTAAGLSPLT